MSAGGFRHAPALQAHAEGLSKQGDASLAQFCTTHGTLRLQEHLNAAWAVLDAPKALSPAPTRLQKLKECATSGPCVCHGVWMWSQLLPLACRVPDFPHCAPCFAAFMLENDAEWRHQMAGGVWL